MNSLERRATLTLACILVLRMTALFMVLPVLAPYAMDLAGHAGLGVGLAVGAYGLTQAVLQIPFGWLSDRIGRKPVILGGLLIFAAGSVLAALAPDIHTLVLGRLLQGGGAIASASTALLADYTRPAIRTTAMAIIGASIGGAFLLALIIGPALVSVASVPGLFGVGAVAAVVAAGLVIALPAAPPLPAPAPGEGWSLSGELLLLDFGVLALHAAMAAVFVAVPLLLQSQRGWPIEQHWKLYLPVMFLALLPVFPMIRWIEKRGLAGRVLPLAVAGLLLALTGLAIVPALLPLMLWLFFVSFNWLEATLPSQVSRLAPGHRRGRAMGLFSSAQFMGAFIGAALGGVALDHMGLAGVFSAAAAIVAVWLITVVGRNPMRNSLVVTD